MDKIVAIYSLTRVVVSCVVGVLPDCISVVPTTVREKATPDSVENEQTKGSSRIFPKVFSVRRVVVELFIGGASRFIHTCTTEMFSITLYAQHPVSLRIFPALLGSRLRFFIAMQILSS